MNEWYLNGAIFHPLMEMYYYYLNSYRESNWFGTKITNWNITKHFGIDPLRNVRDLGYGVVKSGWHFSYLGGVDAIKKKMDAFSDLDLNNETVRNALEDNVNNNKDL
jgi:hypothetical protein